MNSQFGSLPPQMHPYQEEEEKRRITRAAYAKEMQLRAQMAQTRPGTSSMPSMPGVPNPVNLAQQTDLWGENNTGMGLKIMCGVLGLIIIVLVIVLILKLVHHKGQGQTSQVSSGDSQLPMSLQGGGFGFTGESLMSTS